MNCHSLEADGIVTCPGLCRREIGFQKATKREDSKTNKHIQKSDLFHATIFMEREIPALIFFSIRCTERDL